MGTARLRNQFPTGSPDGLTDRERVAKQAEIEPERKENPQGKTRGDFGICGERVAVFQKECSDLEL